MPARRDLVINTGPLLALTAAGHLDVLRLEKRTTATSIPQLLQSTLDPGEAAVVAVATAEHIATVAIDETVGRRIGRLHGLLVTGSLGILIQAKQHGFPIMMRPAIVRMRQHGIWLSNALEKECLRAAGE